MDIQVIFGLIQILLALLIFAVGLPTLILQFGLDDRIARLIHKRLPRRGTWSAMLGGSLMIAGVLWVPMFTDGPTLVERFGGKGNLFLMERLIVTASLLAVFLFWRHLFSKDFRIELANKLEEATVVKTDQGPTLVLEALEDLLFFGEFSSAGYRKELVIKTLANVAKCVQEAEGYEGSELNELVEGFSRVVENRTESGNDNNFLQCGYSMAEIWRRARNSKRGEGADAINCLHAMSNLCVMSVRRCAESTCRELLELVDSEPDLYLRVGVAAIECKRWRIAIAAASRLESIYRREGGGMEELFGLVAHLERAGGEASRFAREILGRLHVNFRKVRRGCREYFYSVGEFDISEALERVKI